MQGWRGVRPHSVSYVRATWQWAVTAAVDFSLAQWIGTTILLSTGTALNGGYNPPRIVIIAIYAFILFVHGLLNTCPVTVLAKLETISVWWHIGGELLPLPLGAGRVVTDGWMVPSLPGTFLLIFLLPFVSPTTQTASYVFATYTEDPSTGITSSPYLFLLGLLFAQYSLSGFDASAHMVTHRPPLLVGSGERILMPACGVSDGGDKVGGQLGRVGHCELRPHFGGGRLLLHRRPHLRHSGPRLHCRPHK